MLEKANSPMSEEAYIQLSTSINVVGPKGSAPATLVELSRAGARLVSRLQLGDAGATLVLDLGDTKVRARVVRSTAGAREHSTSVLFLASEAAEQQGLQQMIAKLMAGDGGGKRKHPRVARRVDMRYGNLHELQAQLQDISRGGLSMIV